MRKRGPPMKAAVLYGPGQPLVVEEIVVDAPRAGEVMVATGATGVCHSDLHFIEGSYTIETPAVLGHESAGVVESVGEGVVNVKPGDRVVIAFITSCGHCEACVVGKPYLCRNSNRLGRPDRLRLRGSNVKQFQDMGA